MINYHCFVPVGRESHESDLAFLLKLVNCTQNRFVFKHFTTAYSMHIQDIDIAHLKSFKACVEFRKKILGSCLRSGLAFLVRASRRNLGGKHEGVSRIIFKKITQHCLVVPVLVTKSRIEEGDPILKSCLAEAGIIRPHHTKTDHRYFKTGFPQCPESDILLLC